MSSTTASVLELNGIKTTKDEEDLIIGAKNFALLNGVGMRTAEHPGLSDVINYAPFTLFPTIVPRRGLEEVKDLQQSFNLLMHKVAHDHNFLEKSLHNVIQVDDFTRRLWDIYMYTRKEGVRQPISLGLFRNDFMMDTGQGQNTGSRSPQEIGKAVKFKQIEFNTIASSFGGLVTQLTDVHRFTLTKAGVDFTENQVPTNFPSRSLAEGLIEAWKIYEEENKSTKKSAILFLVGKPERNALDQVWLEKQIFHINPKIPVLYSSLQELSSQDALQDDKGHLVVDGTDIAVVYFRDGYAPNHYKTDKDWETRLKIETSRAIKCPTVSYQLAGTKKIQQRLAEAGVLEKYVQDSEEVRRIRSLFAGQFSLDRGQEGDAAVKMGIENPGKFVLKPQREGGGNNLYDEELKDKLTEIKDTDERSAYILMEKIHPWVQHNYLIKVGEHSKLRDVVSEIGIYGVLIAKGRDDIMVNKEAGHLMRTKALGVNEGGVASGFATLDTPFLID